LQREALLIATLHGSMEASQAAGKNTIGGKSKNKVWKANGIAGMGGSSLSLSKKRKEDHSNFKFPLFIIIF